MWILSLEIILHSVEGKKGAEIPLQKLELLIS